MNKKHKTTLSPYVATKKIYLWNMMGSLTNAMFYMLLLMAVNRIGGEYEGGIFAIGYAIASLTWVIGSFQTDTYQATDAKDVYSFGHYLAQKIILCLIMIGVSIGITLVRGGSSYEQAIIMLLCLFKALDAFSGVFYARLQKYGRLDISGKSLCVRMALSIVTLMVIRWFSGSLILAIAASCITEVLWIVGYEMRLVAGIYGMQPRFEFEKIARLTMECFPLFIGVFLLTFLTNLPKYMIDAYYEPQMQAAFSSLFMPAAVINLLGLFAFRPSLTMMAECWAQRDFLAFGKKVFYFLRMIAALTMLAMAFAWVIGTRILSFFYSVDLMPYRIALVIIMLGGGFSATATFLNYMLTIMRKQKYVLIGNVISTVLSLVLCVPMVRDGGIMGAAMLYVATMMFAGVPMMIAALGYLREKRAVARD